MRHGSLFSGIGGFDLAAEWMGWENIFHCEWMPLPRQVLHYHFPNSISYEDITKTDFTIHRGNIDILTGGFPCQPYSSAGKRLGKEDERHLWPHMLRAIQEIAPTYVVGENVRGLTNWNGGVVFEEVCADLENCGYEVQPILLPACAVGAPHRRDRVWFVAKNTLCSGCLHGKSFEERNEVWQQRNIGARDSEWICRESNKGAITNTFGIGRNKNEWGGNRESNEFNKVSEARTTTNTNCERSESRNNNSIGKIPEAYRFKQLYDSKWEKFPTQSPICGGDDGLPTELDGITFSKWRQESIKGYGNAIVPQVAYQIFNVIQMMDENRIPRKTNCSSQRSCD